MNDQLNCKSAVHTCCIVGGGPAGLMLGYLLARSGIDVVVVEKHKDFLRDFRGDTIHPSTLELMSELGVLDEFLLRPHQRLDKLKLSVPGDSVTLADFSKIRAKCQYIAFMPQWDFLDFIAEQASAYPSFHLITECEALSLLSSDGRITGVRAETRAGPLEIEAAVTIAADGRSSVLRDDAHLPLQELGAPIDVLWMRVPKNPQDAAEFLARFGRRSILVTIDRGDYWQCAYVIPKGKFEELKALGIEHLRDEMVEIMPSLLDDVENVATWEDCSLLTVAVNRLTTWSRPGFLCIGDAAHAMSPIGGVGINLAIQDAVATANELVPVLDDGSDIDAALQKVQKRREFPAKVIQRFQVLVQNKIIGAVLDGSGNTGLPAPLRVVQFLPVLRRVLARVIGIGIRPEHIRTPERLQ